MEPGALHLRAILAHLPEGVSPVVALPGWLPAGLGDVRAQVSETPDTPPGRLRWEQVSLPLIAHRLGIKVLHVTRPGAPLMGGLRIVFSPCDFGVEAGDWFAATQEKKESPNFLERLRGSFARGGMARVDKVLWPHDLPGAGEPGWMAGLPPFVPPGFMPGEDHYSNQVSRSADLETAQQSHKDLPEMFILYHGPSGRADLEHLLGSWEWAAGAVGDSYPLLLVGMGQAAGREVLHLAKTFNVEKSILPLAGIPADTLPALYRKCYAVFHPAPVSPWCGPVRLALASGKPLIASEYALTDAVVGPAAFLASPGDYRALGAALVTVIVEEQVAEKLSTAAVQRSAGWSAAEFREGLGEIYLQVLNG